MWSGGEVGVGAVVAGVVVVGVVEVKVCVTDASVCESECVCTSTYAQQV